LAQDTIIQDLLQFVCYLYFVCSDAKLKGMDS